MEFILQLKGFLATKRLRTTGIDVILDGNLADPQCLLAAEPTFSTWLWISGEATVEEPPPGLLIFQYWGLKVVFQIITWFISVLVFLLLI